MRKKKLAPHRMTAYQKGLLKRLDWAYGGSRHPNKIRPATQQMADAGWITIKSKQVVRWRHVRTQESYWNNWMGNGGGWDTRWRYSKHRNGFKPFYTLAITPRGKLAIAQHDYYKATRKSYL